MLTKTTDRIEIGPEIHDNQTNWYTGLTILDMLGLPFGQIFTQDFAFWDEGSQQRVFLSFPFLALPS